MNVKGNDIVLRFDGQVLAAAKSCEINASCDLIEIINPFNPDSAEYKAFMSGRKEWSITSNHLLVNQAKSLVSIMAKGTSHNGLNAGQAAFVRIGPNTRSFNERGFHVVKFSANGSSLISSNKYDTYNDPLDITYMIDELNELSSNEMVAIVTYDAVKLTTDVQNAIVDRLNINRSFVPLINTGYRTSFAAIGGPGYKAGAATYNTNPGSSVITRLEMVDTYAQISRMPTSFTDALQYVGKTFSVQFGIDGYPHSFYQGQVICTQFRVTGSKNALAQGSFQFRGTGAITPVYE